MQLICPYCLKQEANKKSFGAHLTKKHKDVNKSQRLLDHCKALYGKDKTLNLIDSYINENYSLYDFSKMGFEKIIEYLKFSGYARTHSEEKQTERYKNKHKKSVKEKYGVENISQSSEIKKKKEETFSTKFGSYENYLEYCRNNMKKGFEKYKNDNERIYKQIEKTKQTCLDRYNVDNPAKLSYVAQKISDSKKEWWNKFSYEERLELTSYQRSLVTHRGGFESKLESRIQNILYNNDIEYAKHVHMFNYNYDIIIHHNIIIEIQGDMWHAHPSIYTENDLIIGKIPVIHIWEKDCKKRNKAIDNGFKMVYIWEHEINSMDDETILQTITNRGLSNESRYYCFY